MHTAVLVLLLSAALAGARHIPMKWHDHVVKNLDYKSVNVPPTWDWRNVNGTRLVPPIRNQHAPSTDPAAYCGSCWAVSTANMLTSRMMISRQGTAAPEALISVQQIINCANSGGCEGGDPGPLLEYASTTGLVDETCNPYLAVDRNCSSWWSRCYTCLTTGCVAISNYDTYLVDEFSTVTTEVAMMAEIAARGPIVCAIHDPPSFKAYNSTDVYIDPSGVTDPTHDILLVGYGLTSNGTKYWVLQNSWGTSWNYPERGFVKLIRGIDNLGVESNGCYWATLKKTW